MREAYEVESINRVMMGLGIGEVWASVENVGDMKGKGRTTTK
jgi:hypothetical protein